MANMTRDIDYTWTTMIAVDFGKQGTSPEKQQRSRRLQLIGCNVIDQEKEDDFHSMMTPNFGLKNCVGGKCQHY